LWGTAIGEHHAQATLRAQFEAKVHSGVRPPVATQGTGKSPNGPVQLIAAGERFANPAEGTVVAQLSIPKIALNQYVVSGTAADDLAKGPGHYIGTALPGQAGNVAIAGHRTTHGAPFNRLGQLAPGDPIYLKTTWGEVLTYTVSQAPYAVSPSDVSVLNDFGDNRLTLTTCNPEFSAAQRLVVVAGLDEPTAATAAKPVAPHAYKLVKEPDPGWAWGELWLVALVGLGLVGLGLLSPRLATVYGRVGKWMILGPIWAAGLYLLFQALTTFLPASV
jgi:sortase A